LLFVSFILSHFQFAPQFSIAFSKHFFFVSTSIETVLQFSPCNMYQRIPDVVSNCFRLVIFFWLFLQFFCVNILTLSGFVLEAVLSPFLSFSFPYIVISQKVETVNLDLAFYFKENSHLNEIWFEARKLKTTELIILTQIGQ